MDIAITAKYIKSKVGGMGAVPTDEGVSFRVWAPNAQKVFVTGDFNGWEKASIALTHEENGFWSVQVPEASTGHQYKYVLKTAQGELMRNDPYAREVTNSVGNSVVVNPSDFDWQNDHFDMPSLNKMVIYELHVGSFNVKEEGKAGDFYGVIEKLDYLKSIGVNVIELMPVAEFPGGFSWGYNPAHPFAVESEYGGPKALKELVKTAHQKGIAVVLDVVYNHFGPTDMDLWQFDGWQENGLGGIYFYNDWRAKTPWGDTRPDYGRSEVRQYIRDNALMWLEEYHIDGLRMDMVPYIRNVNADGNPANDLEEGYKLIQWVNSEIKSRYPEKFTVAEDLHTLDAITAPVENGGLGYSSQWDSQFVHPIRDIIIQMHDEHRNMDVVVASIVHRYNNDVFERVIYTESHDEVSNGQARVTQEIAGEQDVDNWYAKKRSLLGAALMMTAPGIPMLFQGQTMLEDGWFQDTDPIDWSRVSEFKGITKLYRDLIHLRLDYKGITKGLSGPNVEILHVDNQNKVVAFQRWMEGGSKDTTVIVMNFSQQPIENYSIRFPMQGLWKIRFNSDWEGYDNDFDSHFSYDIEINTSQNDDSHWMAAVSLGAYSTIIYSQD